MFLCPGTFFDWLQVFVWFCLCVFVLLQELQGHATQVAEDLPCVSFDSTLSAAQCKLAQLVKTRNVMKFNLYTNCTGQSSSPFSAEEISLLQNIPKGTWKLIFNKSICSQALINTLDRPLIDTLDINTFSWLTLN